MPEEPAVVAKAEALPESPLEKLEMAFDPDAETELGEAEATPSDAEAPAPKADLPVEATPEPEAPVAAPLASPDSDALKTQLDVAMQRTADAERQMAEARQQAAQATLQQQLLGYRQSLESSGAYTPEQIDAAVQREQSIQQREQALVQQQGLMAQATALHEQQAKATTVEHYMNKYPGNDRTDLAKFNDPVSMEAHAKVVSEHVKSSKELADLKQKKTPAQEFDDSTPNPSLNGDVASRRDALRQKGSWTDDEHKFMREQLRISAEG